MWYLWAKENNYKACEICLWYKFNRTHFITIFKEKDKYILCNYKLQGKFGSLKQTIKGINNYNSYIIYKL